MFRSSTHPGHWAALLPVAGAALALSAQTQAHALSPVDEAGVWTFHHEHVLGTSLQITVRASSELEAQRAEHAALMVFDRDAARLSTWDPQSEASRWSRTSSTPEHVSPELFDVLRAFDHWREQTGGALDASVEAATQLWTRATAAGHLPSDAEITEVREAMQQPHWSLDAEHRTATRLSGVPLAFASFTKSYITSRAADVALGAGATGVMLNVGGDVVVRGNLHQWVSLADPQAHAENDPPVAQVVLSNRAMATSGTYRRGLELAAEHGMAEQQSSQTGNQTGNQTGKRYSHIFDPRTGHPTGHVLSSTVIAADAVTAGALATAFSVLTVAETERLAAAYPDVQYRLILKDGRRISSASWPASALATSARPGSASLHPAALHGSNALAAPGMWDPAYELAVHLTLPRINDARYRRPYVAVWIEDADHVAVRTLALWTQNPRWLPELKRWYRDDQVRTLAEGTDISRTISSATRPPGEYSLKWDGKDDEGKPVKAGHYTILVEAAREHGGYDLMRQELDLSGKPQQVMLQPEKELGAVTLDYRKR